MLKEDQKRIQEEKWNAEKFLLLSYEKEQLNSDDNEDENNENFQCSSLSRRLHRKQLDSDNLHLKKDFINDQRCVEVAKRTGTNANQLKNIVSTVVDIAGEDVSKYYLSYSYIYKGHKKQGNNISVQVKAE